MDHIVACLYWLSRTAQFIFLAFELCNRDTGHDTLIFMALQFHLLSRIYIDFNRVACTWRSSEEKHVDTKQSLFEEKFYLQKLQSDCYQISWSLLLTFEYKTIDNWILKHDYCMLYLLSKMKRKSFARQEPKVRKEIKIEENSPASTPTDLIKIEIKDEEGWDVLSHLFYLQFFMVLIFNPYTLLFKVNFALSWYFS